MNKWFGLFGPGLWADTTITGFKIRSLYDKSSEIYIVSRQQSTLLTSHVRVYHGPVSFD